MLFSFAVWAETGDFRDNSHSSMTSVANSLDISQLHFQPPTNMRNNKARDRKADGKFTQILCSFQCHCLKKMTIISISFMKITFR